LKNLYTHYQKYFLPKIRAIGIEDARENHSLLRHPVSYSVFERNIFDYVAKQADESTRQNVSMRGSVPVTNGENEST